MPCNLTARADALISNQALAKMLTQEVVKKALQAFATAQNLTGTREERTFGPTETQLLVGGIRMSVTVNYEGKLGEIGCFVGNDYSVRRGSGRKRSSTYQLDATYKNDLVAALQKHMLLVAGTLMQEKIRTVLANKYQVAAAQRASDGTLVVTLDM